LQPSKFVQFCMFMDENLETINTMLDAINIGRLQIRVVSGSALKDMMHQAEWVIYHSAFEHNNEQVAHHAMAHGSALCVRFKQNHERCWNCVMGSSDSKMCQRVNWHLPVQGVQIQAKTSSPSPPSIRSLFPHWQSQMNMNK